MVSSETDESSEESALYPLVQDYFEKVCKKQCWTERELRGIQKRDWRGRYEAEGRPTPDLVAVDSSVPEIIAVEIKRDTSPEKLDECIGKLMRMLRIANKVYGAFLHPTARTTDIFKVLRESIPQVGLLEINPEKLETPVAELVAAEHREAAVKAEWREYFSLELGRAKAISKKEQLGSELISGVTLDPERRRVIIKISDLAEDLFDAGDMENNSRLQERIEDAIQEGEYIDKYGEQTKIELDSEYFTVCEQCRRVNIKGYACFTCRGRFRFG